MPFGELFLTSIKINKPIRLDITKRFRKTFGGFDWSKRQQFNFPEVSPDELKKIREKIQYEHKQITRKQIIVLGVIMTVFIYYL